MNLEHLQRFLVVADCLNFTVAAERLYVGQSTISRQIASLEHDLGVQLLIRGPRSVELTEAGRVLQREGQKLLNYAEEVKEKVIDADRGTTGEIRISTIPAAFSCITEIYMRVRRLYPNITLNLNYSRHINVLQDLDLGLADLAVTFSFLDPHDDAYEVIPLEESTFYVLCRPDHWIAQHPEGIYRDSLRDEDIVFGRSGLILTGQSQTYHGEPDLAEARSDKSMENDMLSIRTSDKVMVLPEHSVADGKNSLAQIPILDEEMKHQVVLCYRKDSVSSTIERFLEVTQTWLKEKHDTAQ